MKNLFCLLVSIALLHSCKKDDDKVQSMDGTYNVQADDNRGHLPVSGTMTINGTTMSINCGVVQTVQLTINGNQFTVVKNPPITQGGSGMVIDDVIDATIYFPYSTGIDKYDFHGSK